VKRAIIQRVSQYKYFVCLKVKASTHSQPLTMAAPAPSFAPGFFVPPSQSSVLTQPQIPPPIRKSKSRRKRHVPPGPAGVWFQARSHQQQQQQQQQGTSNNDDLLSDGKSNSNNGSNENEQPATDVTTCPAWMLMQLQQPLWLTPYLPHYATIAQRHEALQQHFPSSSHCFLPDIHKGQYDLSTGSRSTTTEHDDDSAGVKLLVLVHAVHSHSHCDWTVELKDETGASISAWIAPSLVMHERDQPDKVRAGVVWCLQDVAILPGTEQQRWLLIHEAAITKYWVAPKEVSHAVYLQWMGKRNALPSSNCGDQGQQEQSSNAGMQQLLNNSNGRGNNTREEEEEEEMEVEPVELPVRTHPRAEPNLTNPEMEDDDVLPADFGMHILSSLHPPAPTTPATPSTTALTTAVLPSRSQIPDLTINDERRESSGVTVSHSQQQRSARNLHLRGSARNMQQQQASHPTPLSQQPQQQRFSQFSATQQTLIPTPSPPSTTNRMQQATASQSQQLKPGVPAKANPYARRREQPPPSTTAGASTSPQVKTAAQVLVAKPSQQPQEHTTRDRQPLQGARPNQQRAPVESTTETRKRPLPATNDDTPSSQRSSSQRNKPKSSKNASFLLQFSAKTTTSKKTSGEVTIGEKSVAPTSRSEPQKSSSDTLNDEIGVDDGVSENIPVAKKKKEKKQSSGKASKSPKKQVSSPKSNLWSSQGGIASSTMMGMLDDDDESEEGVIASEPLMSTANNGGEKSSPSPMFQASNFAGMMGMFDDDDDDD
jgi:hypothetical protein